MTFFRLKGTPNSKYYSLIYDNPKDEMPAEDVAMEEGENEDNDDKQERYTQLEKFRSKPNKNKLKHHTWMTETEKITLINIIKSLDKDCLLINTEKIQKMDDFTCEKRWAIWRKATTALNEICGTNYNMKKVKWSFTRMKCLRDTKYYSLIHDHPQK